VQLDDLPTARADPAPAADERNVAEQRRLKRKSVEAVGVLGPIDTVHQERHSENLPGAASIRPTQVLNRLASVDSGD